MTKTRSRTTATVARHEAAAERQPDDLKQIRGIGSASEQHLHKAGIRSFVQLAAMTPDRLGTSTGLSVHRIIKGNWIGQARKLGRQQAQSHHVKSARVARDHQHYATFTIELLLNEDNSVRRTRIVHIQGSVDEVWPDWDEARLVSFLASQTGLRAGSLDLAPLSALVAPPDQIYNVAPDSSGDEPALLSESALSPARAATVSSAEGFPPPAAKTNLSTVSQANTLVTIPCELDIPQDAIYAGQLFSVRFSMDLNELQRSAHTPLTYTVTVWAKKLGEKSRQIVGDQQGTCISVDKFLYTAEAVITSQGTYRLEAVATLGQPEKESSPQNCFVAAQRSRLLQVY
jgi:hypothetical protein